MLLFSLSRARVDRFSWTPFAKASVFRGWGFWAHPPTKVVGLFEGHCYNTNFRVCLPDPSRYHDHPTPSSWYQQLCEGHLSLQVLLLRISPSWFFICLVFFVFFKRLYLRISLNFLWAKQFFFFFLPSGFWKWVRYWKQSLWSNNCLWVNEWMNE